MSGNGETEGDRAARLDVLLSGFTAELRSFLLDEADDEEEPRTVPPEQQPSSRGDPRVGVFYRVALSHKRALTAEAFRRARAGDSTRADASEVLREVLGEWMAKRGGG